MNRLFAFYRSTVGKKVIMALTGLIMVGFLISHVLANLLVFEGPERLNHYAAFLRTLSAGLWVARGVLLLALVFHVVAAVQLTRLDRAARPVAYVRKQPQVTTLAARTLRWGGALLLGFIIFHLLHFTTGSVHPQFVPGDVYRNVIVGFRDPLVVLLYVVAMAALGLHLYHGVWASLRSLGVAPAAENVFQRPIAAVLAALVWIGFSVIPLAVYFGLVG